MTTKSKAVLRVVPIREVIVPKGRKRDAERLDELIASINEVGLINPITVTKDLLLVAGLHRLQACEIIGWKQIPANVLSLDQLEAELVEIDENLCRTELTALERGTQTARRKAIYEARHPETRQGIAGAIASNRKQGKGKHASAVSAFASNTAAKTGRSRRSVEEDAQIGEGIAPSVQDTIRDTSLADRKRQLIELVQVKDPARQAQVADLVASGKAKNVADAQAQLAAAEAEGAVVRDELGQEITDPDLAEVFLLLRPRALEVVRHLRAGRRAWGDFHEEQEKAERIRILCAKGYIPLRTEIEDLKLRASLIVLGAPYAICPYCKGAPLVKDRKKWCEGCHGGGWVTKSSYDSAPPETKVQPTSDKSGRGEVSHGR